MPKLTFDLRPQQVVQLDRIAEALGVDRDQAIASLIGRAAIAMSKEIREDGPWEVTLAAKECLLRIFGRPATPENLDWADGVLHAACIDAHRAEREGRRKPAVLESGALRYRGPRPRQLILIVKNGALITVQNSHQRGG